MGTQRCKWVRGRLPLLVGDDLRGLDRRRVERHLIGCPGCRQHQAALGEALVTLRAAGATSPASSDVPSLWPALARQIRESRRPAPAPGFPFGLATAWPRIGFKAWPVLGLAAGLGLLVALGIGLGVRRETAAARVHIAANRRPIAPARVVPEALEQVSPAPSPHREPPAPAESTVVDTPAPRIDYDLEHGRPMPDVREARDVKATY